MIVEISTIDEFNNLPVNVQDNILKILAAVVVVKGINEVSNLDVRGIIPESYDFAEFNRYKLSGDVYGRLCIMIAHRLLEAADATTGNIITTIINY